jgi:hypothetical protein
VKVWRDIERKFNEGPFSLTAAFAAALFMLWSAPAAGQETAKNCMDRKVLVLRLAARYQEAPSWRGATSRGLMLEIFTNADGGTWTLAVSTPTGMSCMVASGEGWRNVERVIEEPKT